MTDTHPNTVDMMTLPDTALMSPGHVCSLYHCIVCGLCGDVGGGEIQVRLPALVPGLRLSSPTAALQPLPVTTSLHRAEKLTTTFLPSYHRLGLGCICTAISSQVALSFVLCISNNVITSSNTVSAVFQDTHVLDNNCV